MKLHLFKDGSGTIHGADQHHISINIAGTLTVGNTAITVTVGDFVCLPPLKDGTQHVAKFTTADGTVYSLGRYNVRNGLLVSSTAYTAQEIKLKHRADKLETELQELRSRFDKLEKAFDTNSLNFLIKKET